MQGQNGGIDCSISKQQACQPAPCACTSARPRSAAHAAVYSLLLLLLMLLLLQLLMLLQLPLPDSRCQQASSARQKVQQPTCTAA